MTFLFVIGMLFFWMFFALAQILLPAGLVSLGLVAVPILSFVVAGLLIVFVPSLLRFSPFFLGIAAQSSLVTISLFLTGYANQLHIFVLWLIVWSVSRILFRIDVSYRLTGRGNPCPVFNM